MTEKKQKKNKQQKAMNPVMIPGGRGGLIKPIQPGESRNPAGYSKARRDQKALQDMLDEIIEGTDKDKLRMLLESIYGNAVVKGDTFAAKLLLERAYGKVPDKVEHIDEAGNPTSGAVSEFMQLLERAAKAKLIEGKVVDD